MGRRSDPMRQLRSVPGLLAIIALAVLGCAAAAVPAVIVSPAPRPSVGVMPSADVFVAACETAFIAAEDVIDEVAAILKASGTSEGSTDVLDVQALVDHLEAAENGPLRPCVTCQMATS